MSWKARAAEAANRALKRFDTRLIRGSDLWRPTAALGSQPEPGVSPPDSGAAFLHAFNGATVANSAAPSDCAVIIPTTLKPTLLAAVESVFEQQFDGTLQVLIGIDRMVGSVQPLLDLMQRIPPNVSVTIMYPGYSTSRRHGGLHPAFDGGALRTILSYMANSRQLAYLDDDNWWAPDHVATILAALEGHDWAFARRVFVHPGTLAPICEDTWESIGSGEGNFRESGGWVDPNCIALDKLRCEAVLRWWSIPLRNSRKAMDADHNVFRILSTEFSGRDTHKATVFYVITESDDRHPSRLQAIGQERYAVAGQQGRR